MATYYLLDGTEHKEISLDDILKAEKLVKESDALTLKGSIEANLKRVEKELDETKTKLDQTLTRALTAESTVEERTKELEPLKEKAEKFTTLEPEFNALKEKHLAAETQLLTTRRNSLIEKYNLEGEKKTSIESMSADELTSAEKTASLFGNPSSRSPQNNFDRNNGGNRQNLSEGSALDDLREGLKEIRVANGSSADD